MLLIMIFIYSNDSIVSISLHEFDAHVLDCLFFINFINFLILIQDILVLFFVLSQIMISTKTKKEI